MFTGGNLSRHFDYWKEITTNTVVLDWIENGVQLPFAQQPQPFHFQNSHFSNKEKQFVSKEIEELLLTGCIEECHFTPEYISPIRTVPKKDSFRLVLDLSHLNSFCSVPSFVYEDIREVLNITRPTDKIITWDIKSGFHHVSIHKNYFHYLCFSYAGKYYYFKVLPFGASCSSYVFGKIIRTVVQHFRSHDNRLVAYVDDFYHCNSDDTILASRDWILSELQNLGWFINVEKSKLEPASKAKFIGYIIETKPDSDSVCLRIPKDRVKKLKRDIRRVLHKGSASARALARIAGQCVSMIKVVIPAKLLLRNLYRCLKRKVSWQDVLELDKDTKADLNWWLRALDVWNFNQFKSDSRPCIQIATDASQEGFGGKMMSPPGLETHGCWDTIMSHKSSNCRELVAVLMCLHAFLPAIRGRSVVFLTDNITTCCYVQMQGGPVKQLHSVAAQIWTLALSNDIHLEARYLAGHENVQADQLSRLNSQYEWEIHQELFNFLDTQWGPHTIDRFASLTTTKCVKYNSLYLDHKCWGVDALVQSDWSTENNYVNPPVRLLDKIIKIIIKQKAIATIIAPEWKAKNFFWQLKKLSITPPIRLPKARHFCIQRGMRVPEAMKNPKWVWYAFRIFGGISL